MRDDEADDAERGRHDVATVPPPAGESDIYDAKTQVGGLPPEAMALLRQLREGPETGRSIEEANVPVFVEDSGASSDPAPASSKRSAAPIRPAAGAPAARPAPAPAPTPAAPQAPPPAAAPMPDYSVMAPVAPASPSPLKAARVPEAFDIAPRAPGAPPAEPREYQSVFAPLAGEAPARVAPPPPAVASTSRTVPIVIVGVLVLMALLVVVLAQAGMIPGLAPLGAPPAHSAAPAH